MKAIQRDLVLLGVIEDFLGWRGTEFEESIENYDGEKVYNLLKAEIGDDEDKLKQCLIKSAQQLYKKIEKKFPENKQK